MRMWSAAQDVLFCTGLALVVGALASNVQAQTAARTFADLGGVVKVGQEITVTDASGAEVKGKITQLSPTSLTLAAGEATRTFAETDVRLIQQKRGDSLVNGILIGAASGAVPMIIAAQACGDCEGEAAGIAVGVAFGAGIGALIDYAVKGNKTVFVPGEGTKPSVSVAPLIDRDRKGVQVALRF